MIPAIFCALAGLAFGSFLNVCISRLPRGESVVRPRSHCRKCGEMISNRDNIPLLSWVVLKGRCRSCGAAIHWRYPLVEICTCLLFIACLFRFSEIWQVTAWAVFCWLLLGLAVMDAETMLLPDGFTIPGIVLGVLFAGLRGTVANEAFNLGAGWKAAGFSLLDAGCAAMFLLLVFGTYWLARRRRGLGMGDVKLIALLGAWLGLPRTALAFTLAAFLGAVYGLALLGRPTAKRKGTASTLAIPFGTFLCLGGLYAVFLGDRTLRWYAQFFH
jgi:leader peptidase (prepilin peptidase) / N-methyltransferase